MQNVCIRTHNIFSHIYLQTYGIVQSLNLIRSPHFSTNFPLFFELTTTQYIMKPTITEAELRFLLDEHEIDESKLQQVERLETCASLLRALQAIYPEKMRHYLALFIIFSILNPLEHKLITPLHPQVVLFVITIATNLLGLIILKYNGADWITTCLEDVQIGLLPPVTAYRSALIALAPITTVTAIFLQKRILRKFE